MIAKLVGVAPLNRDSGTLNGRLNSRCFYEALKARAKAPEVALVASMRKLLVALNARLRDEWFTITAA